MRKEHSIGLCLILLVAKCETSKPNILLIVADDLGYNDVSWHNPDIISPNLKKLAQDGLLLEQAYVEPICTPTRSSLLTGYYPSSVGRQHSVIWPQEPKGLFTNFTLLPEYLSRLGYQSHAVGKWHLGFCDVDYLPTRRGFETFFGFYTGSQDYYEHTRVPAVGDKTPGYDFRENDRVNYGARGKYSANEFSQRAIELIHRESAANSSADPFFIYLAFQNVHSPLQVPQKYVDMYPGIKNKARRTFSAMVTALDDAVGNVTKALKDTNTFDNTLIVFTSDNGGQTMAGGNNYPLRGNKATLWEGGTRAASFVHAPFIPNKGSVHRGLIHVSDWVPTLVAAAGGKVEGDIDGVNQWPALSRGLESPRKEMLYNERAVNNGKKTVGAAIRVGDYKLILGEAGKPDGWIKPAKVVDISSAECIFDNCADIFDMALLEEGNFCQPNATLTHDDRRVQLFNLAEDPEERHDLARAHPGIVKKLLNRLHELEKRMIPPDVALEIPEGNPNRFGGVFSSGWCKAEPAKFEDLVNIDVY